MSISEQDKAQVRRELAASGGRATAARLTPAERTEKARAAARARWGRRPVDVRELAERLAEQARKAASEG